MSDFKGCLFCRRGFYWDSSMLRLCDECVDKLEALKVNLDDAVVELGKIEKRKVRRVEEKMSRGGKRKGAGRPFGATSPEQFRREPYATRLPLWLIKWLKSQPQSQGKMIEEGLIEAYELEPPKRES